LPCTVWHIQLRIAGPNVGQKLVMTMTETAAANTPAKTRMEFTGLYDVMISIGAAKDLLQPLIVPRQQEQVRQ
jgi:hypothetical protein